MSKVRLTFVKRNGKLFTKTFKSISTAKRAILGWRAAGGRMAGKMRTPNGKGFGKTTGSTAYRSSILR